METDRSSWASVVRKRRDSLGMTQQQLADAASVSLKTISNIENESLTPQRGTLRKIRDALGLSSDLAVAATQAEEGVGLELAGLKRAVVPVRRSGLDAYLYDIENRLMDLEDRVGVLEQPLDLSGGVGSLHSAQAALDGDQDAGAEEVEH